MGTIRPMPREAGAFKDNPQSGERSANHPKRTLVGADIRKPWLHSIRAVHNYGSDEIRITAAGRETTIQNEPKNTPEEAQPQEPPTRMGNNDAGEPSMGGTDTADNRIQTQERTERGHTTLEGEDYRPGRSEGQPPSPLDGSHPPATEAKPQNKQATEDVRPQRIHHKRAPAKEDEIVEEELSRILQVWASEPAAETRYTKYLEVEEAREGEQASDQTDTVRPQTAPQARQPNGEDQLRMRHTGNRAHSRDTAERGPETASEKRKQRTEADAAEWKRRRETTATGLERTTKCWKNSGPFVRKLQRETGQLRRTRPR
ncbi:unnamed protein product [Mycena citricolor]|uniref:Uncharacterized protein n=1 Tax=Mycena citricolor TaxID=2018698 RepID=A0AAD2JX64_9AGAR|nr:unnamed protein product [Mycena citricolor]